MRWAECNIDLFLIGEGESRRDRACHGGCSSREEREVMKKEIKSCLRDSLDSTRGCVKARVPGAGREEQIVDMID